jgi:hypothetical protein
VAAISDVLGLPSRRHPHHSRTSAVALRHLLCPLPVPAPVHGRAASHRQPHDALDLRAVRHPPVIFAPRGLLSISDQIGALLPLRSRGRCYIIPEQRETLREALAARTGLSAAWVVVVLILGAVR